MDIIMIIVLMLEIYHYMTEKKNLMKKIYLYVK